MNGANNSRHRGDKNLWEKAIWPADLLNIKWTLKYINVYIYKNLFKKYIKKEVINKK
jgi:hypothetical protein